MDRLHDAHTDGDDARRAQLAHDLFDLAAPLLEHAVVARLLPLHLRVPSSSSPSPLSATSAQHSGALLLPIDVLLDARPVVLGRGKELSPPQRIDASTRLSARHCELRVDVLTRRLTLVDTSTNGCYVNGVRVAKQTPVELHAGDVVALTRPYDGTEDKSKNNNKDDAAAATTSRAAIVGDADIAFVLQRSMAERTLREAVAEAQCGVCRGVLWRPCLLLPCMHACCASCISKQLRSAGAKSGDNDNNNTHDSNDKRNNNDDRSEAAEVTIMTATLHCTVCGAHVEEVRPSHKLASLVDELTRRHRRYARSAEDVAAREHVDLVPAVGMRLTSGTTAMRTRSRHHDDDGDDDDSGSDDGRHDKKQKKTAAAATTTATTQRLRHAQLTYAHHDNALLVRQLPLHPCRQCRGNATTTGNGSNNNNLIGAAVAEGGKARKRARAASSSQPQLQQQQQDDDDSMDEYTCAPAASHLVCTACRTLFPERPLCGRPQRCAVCAAPYCGMYYAATPSSSSSPAAAAAGGGGKGGGVQGAADGNSHAAWSDGCAADDHASTSPCFAALAQHRFAALPAAALGGSAHEQHVLQTYMRAHDLDVAAVWRVCVDKLHRREWLLQQPHLVATAATSNVSLLALHATHKRQQPEKLGRQSPVCRTCAARCFAELLLHYRRTLPREQLPEEVAARPNCWQGVHCPLQFRSVAHATHYSHACFAQKGKE